MTDHAAYIREHNLPRLIEALLEVCVPGRHPRPLEAVSQRIPFVRGFNLNNTTTRVPKPHQEQYPSSTPSSSPQRFVFGEDVAPTTTTGTQRGITHEEVRTLDFDIFARAGDATTEQGIDIVEKIFTDPRRNLLTAFNIPTATFKEWVQLVMNNYHAENPFHNFRHAVNVLQTLHCYVSSLHDTMEASLSTTNPLPELITTSGGASTTSIPPVVGFFSDIELLGGYIAALCHDLQHPGVNNTHLIATDHPLAVRYNDRSVLENHHAAVTFSLLDPANNGGVDILSTVRSTGQYRVFRAVVLDCIMGTDVTKHKECIATIHTELTDMLAAESTKNKDVGAASSSHEALLYRLIGHKRVVARGADAMTTFGDEDVVTITPASAAAKRQVLLRAMVEASDISNEARAHRFSHLWAPLVGEEFWQQGDKEKALGMDVGAMFDRKKMNLGRDQQGFINYLCLPLYKELAGILPQTFTSRVAALSNNAAEWAKSM